MKIQPISSWQNGQEKLGTIFNLYVINDNLKDSATFYYSISSEEVSHEEDGVKIVDTYAEKLVDGNLTMDGQDYQTWDAEPSANEWAINWALNKLNLVAVV